MLLTKTIQKIGKNIDTATIYVFSMHLFSHPKHLLVHSSTKIFIQSVVHPSGINSSLHPTNQEALQPYIQRAIFSTFDPSKHPYSSNLCTNPPCFQPPKHLIVNQFTKLSIQSVIHPSFIHLFSMHICSPYPST